MELDYSLKLTSVLIQKHATTNSIKAVLFIDWEGKVTVLGQPDTSKEIFFNQNNWKKFTISEDEQLFNLTNTDDFNKIELVVGRIPQLKKKDF